MYNGLWYILDSIQWKLDSDQSRINSMKTWQGPVMEPIASAIPRAYGEIQIFLHSTIIGLQLRNHKQKIHILSDHNKFSNM